MPFCVTINSKKQYYYDLFRYLGVFSRTLMQTVSYSGSQGASTLILAKSPKITCTFCILLGAQSRGLCGDSLPQGELHKGLCSF